MNFTHQTNNKEVIDFIENKLAAGESQYEIIENLLSIGVAVLSRVQASVDVDFVKKESQKIMNTFDQTVNKLEAEIFNKVTDQINQFFNPDKDDSHTKKFSTSLHNNMEEFKNQIIPIIKASKEISDENVKELESKINAANDKFNPELENSYFGKIRAIITKVDTALASQLNDSNTEGFAFKLKAETEKLFGKESPIIDIISNIIESKTKAFEDEVIKLREEIATQAGKEKGIAEIMHISAGKGRKFEEELLDYLEEVAKSQNDIVEYTGDTAADGTSSKKGDFIYHFNGGQSILIEAKDRENGVKPSIDYLKEALKINGLPFGILVHKNDAQVPKSIDMIGFYEDSKIITSKEYLKFAIQWARIFLAKADNKMADGINESLVMQRILDIQTKLKNVAQLKSKLTNMRTAVNGNADGIETIIDEIKNDITSHINDIENEFIKASNANQNKNNIKLAS